VIYAPLTAPFLLLLVLLLVLLIVLIEVRVLAYAYRKIGVNPRYVIVVLILSLVGSHVNVPLYSVPVAHVSSPGVVWLFGQAYVTPPVVQRGVTIVAINVGGALIPILVSIYLAMRTRLWGRMLVGTAIVAVVVHALAEIVPGVGIAVPMLLPPLIAAAVGLVLSFRRAPPVAYVAGSMGTLIGADLLNLGRIARLGAPIISIGGAGTFDGVFLTGIIAGLLA
jgi:uncharacterized membrane protein